MEKVESISILKKPNSSLNEKTGLCSYLCGMRSNHVPYGTVDFIYIYIFV